MNKDNTTLKPCPFCKKPPIKSMGKISYCQMHGDKSQSVRLHCRKYCRAKLKISCGDIYNGGYDEALQEAIEGWNDLIDLGSINAYDDLKAENKKVKEENYLCIEEIKAWGGQVDSLKAKNKALEERVAELEGLMAELGKYLDKGHGTAISAGSIFHSQIKEQLNKTKEG